jgi:hypothetical protein
MKRSENSRFSFTLILLLGIAANLFPMDDLDERGDASIAHRYALWAKNAIDQGLWAEALISLERSSDFADVSSDICYLLALTRSHEKKDRASVLEALQLALTVDRWNLCKAEDARLLKIENLIALRAYSDALHELSMVSKSPEEALFTLKILAASGPAEFRRCVRDVFDRFPREPGPVRVFLKFLKAEDSAGRNPETDDLQLLELVSRRLPVLLSDDPELAWMTAPYLRDAAEAKRLVQAYRAVHKPLPESLPAALKLGVIDEETALEELFTPLSLDIALLDEIWDLLRREEARTVFKRNLSAFTGVLTEDADGDGFSETFAEYHRGVLTKCDYDPAQIGIPDLTVFFEAGNPVKALALIPPEKPEGFPGGVSPASANMGSRKSAAVSWERYPSVLEVEFDGATFISRPLDHFFSPVGLAELWGSGVFFPRRDPLSSALTRRVLVSQSLRVERPSLEFSGGIEVVELNQGIPVRAREYVGELMVSETEFLRGRPQLQRVDLAFGGHWDTVRHFRRNYRAMELEELWDYDRDFDYTVNLDEE